MSQKTIITTTLAILVIIISIFGYAEFRKPNFNSQNIVTSSSDLSSVISVISTSSVDPYQIFAPNTTFEGMIGGMPIILNINSNFMQGEYIYKGISKIPIPVDFKQIGDTQEVNFMEFGQSRASFTINATTLEGQWKNDTDSYSVFLRKYPYQDLIPILQRSKNSDTEVYSITFDCQSVGKYKIGYCYILDQNSDVVGRFEQFGEPIVTKTTNNEKYFEVHSRGVNSCTTTYYKFLYDTKELQIISQNSSC